MQYSAALRKLRYSVADGPAHFRPRQSAVFRRLTTSGKIQRFLDHDLAYNKGARRRDLPLVRAASSAIVPRSCMRRRALRRGGAAHDRPPAPAARSSRPYATTTTCSLSSSYRGHWGALAKSNYSGLRYREPVYRTLRELVDVLL